MKNDQLQSRDSSIHQIEDLSKNAAQAVQTVTPTAANLVSYTGTDAAYTLVVAPTSIENTAAGEHWDTLVAEGKSHHYSPYPYVRVTFNQDLPNGTTLTLRNAAGMLVETSTVKNTSVREVMLKFGFLSNGQHSLSSQGNYTLTLDNPTPGSFLNHDIDSTGGGLVIIANVDGCIWDYDPTRKASYQKALDKAVMDDLR